VSYSDFLTRKAVRAEPTGIAEPGGMHSSMFAWQADVCTWALRRGRAALFLDTGLGKSLIALEWSRHVSEHTGGNVLILTPLAVAAQFVREGAKFGIGVTHCRGAADVKPGINVTNYDRLHLFDPAAFAGVVLDESSILKSVDGSTRAALTEAFAATPFKLACTATPAPNDHTELGQHAEWLGIMRRTEMLSQWFVHDGGSTQDWRVKGHAADDFWRWVCSWGLLVRKPSDLGYPDGSHELPPLEMVEHVIPSSIADAQAAGSLFVEAVVGLNEQRKARRVSLADRVAKCAALVAAEPDRPWLIWCELNDEGDALEAAIPGAVQVAGADSADVKEQRMSDFGEGRARVLISKASVCGFGMNWQHCSRVAFVGVSHSFEQFYQAVRRCWRFGQAQAVRCHLITSEAEGAVSANLKRKQREAERMADEMRQYVGEHVRGAARATVRESTAYQPAKRMSVPAWLTSGAE
jgi:hypothetical protein